MNRVKGSKGIFRGNYLIWKAFKNLQTTKFEFRKLEAITLIPKVNTKHTENSKHFFEHTMIGVYNVESNKVVHSHQY